MPEWRDLVSKVTSIESEKKAIEDRGTIAHVMQEKPTPAMAFVLNRGEYDQKKEEVKAVIPGRGSALMAAAEANCADAARALVTAYEASMSAGSGAATHEGVMIDAASVRMARAVLGIADRVQSGAS